MVLGDCSSLSLEGGGTNPASGDLALIPHWRQPSWMLEEEEGHRMTTVLPPMLQDC